MDKTTTAAKHCLLQLRLACALYSIFCTQNAQTEPCQPYTPEAAKAQAQDLRVGRISIRAGNLFNLNDPSQTKRMHSVANSLHISSRESTISDILTFSSGEAFSEKLLAESERSLRKKRYLHDATIVAHQLCGNVVNIEVLTIDNWTLTPSVSFGSAGGETRYAYEIQDLNVLGLGKELRIQQSHNGDLKSSNFRYADDNVMGSRYQFQLGLAKTDDGSQTDIQGGLPYYSLSSANSWWLSLSSVHDSYDDPDSPDNLVPIANQYATFKISTLLPSSTARYARVGVGARITRQRTEIAETQNTSRPAYDFDESYLFISAQWGNSEWSKRQNYQSLRATEDIHLGLNVDVELGLIANALGNDKDAFRLNIDMTNSWYDYSQSLHKVSYQQTQYFNGSEESKFALSARYQYFRWIGENNQLDLRLTCETHQGYSPLHDFFCVGGANGLKA